MFYYTTNITVDLFKSYLYSLLYIVVSSLTTDPPGLENTTLFADTYIDLVCSVSFNDNITNNITNIAFTWTDPTNMSIVNNNTHYTLLYSNSQYSQRLRINRLNISRDNGSLYTCAVITNLNVTFQSHLLLNVIRKSI